jgi:hypothetical protein
MLLMHIIACRVFAVQAPEQVLVYCGCVLKSSRAACVSVQPQLMMVCRTPRPQLTSEKLGFVLRECRLPPDNHRMSLCAFTFVRQSRQDGERFLLRDACNRRIPILSNMSSRTAFSVAYICLNVKNSLQLQPQALRAAVQCNVRYLPA